MLNIIESVRKALQILDPDLFELKDTALRESIEPQSTNSSGSAATVHSTPEPKNVTDVAVDCEDGEGLQSAQ